MLEGGIHILSTRMHCAAELTLRQLDVPKTALKQRKTDDRALKLPITRCHPHILISGGNSSFTLAVRASGDSNPGTSVINLSETLRHTRTYQRSHPPEQWNQVSHTLPAALTPASVRAALPRSTFLWLSELSLDTAPASQSALNKTASIVLAWLWEGSDWLISRTGCQPQG
jgi:hypothetical protein